MTSRPNGYRTARLERIDEVEVQTFSPAQTREFIQRWYYAEEFVNSGYPKEKRGLVGVQHRASQRAEDLVTRLAQPKAAGLQSLTVNPLLLTMIAMVHRYRGALPGSRVELYREMCAVFLRRRRQSIGVQDSLNADHKQAVLQVLAARMMAQNLPEIGTSEALAIVRPQLVELGLTETDIGTFLEHIRDSSGLLLERELGEWGFSHKTFQEYLTSAFWVREKQFPADCSSLINNVWWEETLRLYAAQADAPQFSKLA